MGYLADLKSSPNLSSLAQEVAVKVWFANKRAREDPAIATTLVTANDDIVVNE